MYHFRGAVLPDGDVRDVYIGADGCFADGPIDARTVLNDGVLLPGLVDVHAHLSLSSPAGDDAPDHDRVRASARRHLEMGVLALREPGSPTYAAAGLGPSEGLPRTVTAGHFLAPPGSYFPGLAREVDPDELGEAALQELAASGAWVKIIGDSPLPDRMRRTYDDGVLQDVARLIHERGGRLAIHCALPETIAAAVAAGFDSLEHGSFMPADLLSDVKASGAAWVPTCGIDGAIRGLVRQLGYSESAVREIDQRLDAQPQVLRAAADLGVLLLAGTDAGMVPHGLVGEEVKLLLDAGVDPTMAIGAASWTARSWLGLPNIEAGAPADLVAYRDDPRDDPAVLTRPAAVVLNGVLL